LDVSSDGALPSINGEDVIAHATGAAVARDQHIAHDIAGLERPQELKNDVAKSQHIGKRDLFLLPFQ
jgi:hypothetical protein